MTGFEQSVREVAAWLGEHAEAELLQQAAEAVKLPLPVSTKADPSAAWRAVLRHAAQTGQLPEALAPLEQAENPLSQAMADAFVRPEHDPEVLVVPSSRTIGVGLPAGVFLGFLVVALLLPSAPFVPEWSSSYELGPPTGLRIEQLQAPDPPSDGSASPGSTRPTPLPAEVEPPGEISDELAVEPDSSDQATVGDPSDGLDVEVGALPPRRTRAGRVFLDGVEQGAGRPDATPPTPSSETPSPETPSPETPGTPSTGAPETPAGTGAPPPPPSSDRPLRQLDPAQRDPEGGSGRPPESESPPARPAGSGIRDLSAASDGCTPGADVKQWPCRRYYHRPPGCPESPEGYVGWWWAGPQSPGVAGELVPVQRGVHVRCDRPREENGYDRAMPVASSLSRGHWVRISGPPVQVGSSWYVPLRQGDYPIPEHLR